MFSAQGAQKKGGFFKFLDGNLIKQPFEIQFEDEMTCLSLWASSH